MPEGSGFSVGTEEEVICVDAVDKDQLEDEIGDLKDEIHELLSRLTFDDIMIYVLATNLHFGRVWANYQLLKDFFELLKTIDDWASEEVVRELDRLQIIPDIDHCLTRLGIGGLFSWDDTSYMYMNDLQHARALRGHGSYQDSSTLSDLRRISALYAEELKINGRG